MKILCTGDIHIGRASSRLPRDADPRVLSAAECWLRIAEHAVREGVDVVAVSGDMVDRANRFYEAAGPVEQGLRRLDDAGIDTVMVSGNHDFDVLPWLVDRPGYSRVRLLGRGGRWERVTIERNGRRLHVDGWSFPQAVVRTSPVADYPFGREDVPVLGLLHADLDQPASPYAPVALGELSHLAPSVWLLGHIHAPRLIRPSAGGTVLYPGSPQALDPGEPGAHGAWLMELEPGVAPRLRLVPLSTVRYEQVEVDADGVEEALELDHRLERAVANRLDALIGEHDALRHLSCRVTVTGRTPLYRGLEARLGARTEELGLRRGEARASVERVRVAARPPLDLEDLARATDAAGVLARMLLDWEAGAPGAAHAALVAEARRRATDAARAAPYRALGSDEPPGEDAIEAELRAQAMRLLDELAAQKEAPR
jgi:DNA repair protein SbcD/Mre11